MLDAEEHINSRELKVRNPLRDPAESVCPFDNSVCECLLEVYPIVKGVANVRCSVNFTVQDVFLYLSNGFELCRNLRNSVSFLILILLKVLKHVTAIDHAQTLSMSKEVFLECIKPVSKDSYSNRSCKTTLTKLLKLDNAANDSSN